MVTAAKIGLETAHRLSIGIDKITGVAWNLKNVLNLPATHLSPYEQNEESLKAELRSLQKELAHCQSYREKQANIQEIQAKIEQAEQAGIASAILPQRKSIIELAAEGTTPPSSRLLALQKKQCDIFGTTYNPDHLRLGNKVLRQRLKGPILAAYYPRKAVTIADIQKEVKQYGLETYNEDEEDRLEGLQIAKLRGKGAPKKKRTADTTKKGRKKK